MTWLLLALLAGAQTLDSVASAVPTCEKVGLNDIAEVTAPAVIVLGERRGVWPDLLRAERLVRRLAARGDVTLALQAVRADQQPVLDQFVAGSIGLHDVPKLTRWQQNWGVSWSAYEGLVDIGGEGVPLLAVGAPVQLRPTDAVVPLAPGYLHVLLDAVGEHAVPVELEPDFIQTMAWLDHRMARTALERWDGEGVLVVVVDRLHVEGGKGVPWQAQQLTEHPVTAALLADANSPCYPGDRIWRDHPLDR